MRFQYRLLNHLMHLLMQPQINRDQVQTNRLRVLVLVCQYLNKQPY